MTNREAYKTLIAIGGIAANAKLSKNTKKMITGKDVSCIILYASICGSDKIMQIVNEWLDSEYIEE